jgi:hypothetical protein
MKYENLRKGMVFEFIENRRNTEKASDDPTKFWEVIKLNQEQEREYLITQIVLGRLADRQTFNADIEDLNNPRRWTYHEGAGVQEVMVKQLSFLDGRDSIMLSQNAVSESPTVKGNVVDIANATVPVSDIENTYAKYANCTIDDWELIADAFFETKGFDTRKEKPKSYTRSYQIHSQEWSAFTGQKTVREIRDLRLRITDWEQNTSPCSYQTIIRRLLQGCQWFGRPQHRQFLTQALQKRIHKNR